MTARSRLSSVRLAAVAVALTLVAVACGSTDSATTTTSLTSTQAPATTAAPGTTAVTTTVVTDTNSLADGSGCTPGTADRLPDGEWYGYVSDAAATELDFDLACWFTGDAAATAAAEDGQESPPPNDYYVRNVNPALRTLGVDAAATVTWLPNPGDPSTAATVGYAQWLAGRTTRDFQPGVWLTIAGGNVTDIQEQFVP